MFSTNSSNTFNQQAASPRTDLDGDSNMNNGVLSSVRQPDHDAIKMFVGQIPRSMDEADLRKMFEEFGEVYQINVLRDKMTGVSKGCCFVTFYTRKAALEAQNLLHNIKTLQGMHHPIQMKPADTENRLDRKLFLGMLCKRYSESEVRMMFNCFGTIEDCSVLRDGNGQSKGCAFVTFSSRQSAITAIKKLHHSVTMEGCSMPLVVKFADTPKEKDQKKLQQQTQSLWNAASTNALAALGPQYLALLQQSMNNSPTNSSMSGGGNAGNGTAQYGNLGGLGSAGSTAGSTASTLSQLNNLGNMSTMQQLLAASQNPVGGQHQMFDTSGLTMNMQNLAALAALASANPSSLQALSQPGYPSNMATGLSSSNNSLGGASAMNSAPSSNPAGKQVEGPPGANLFIYHLPQEFTDQDLAQCFWPYGKVISAKVFIDKQTNLSKCFGFVSYENAQDAQNAISAMNGQQVGNKRLKVQLKRPKDSRPY